ncbi:MAG: hypothetical protein IK082_06410 [Oscillospiraceae bacterium]|nr:hypothetical protein [Oscillospiraceae bacterium]
MELDREQTVERLLSTYGQWYDLTRVEDGGPLVATGEFHEHGTGYILIRKAEMWSADCHEYLYVFSVETLDRACFEQCLAKARELGEPLVKPAEGHKSTYLTVVIICGTADEEGLTALRKCRIRKSFQLSLQGWMEVHTAAVAVRGNVIASNGDGRRTREFLKNVLQPRKKDLRYRLFKK